jgi:hypothetical protein
MQHILVRHAPFFVEKYGSLAVWSCQGMEDSHHAAKIAYQRHMQHSGGRKKKSLLVQLFQHWYRIVAHRFRNKEAQLKTKDMADPTTLACEPEDASPRAMSGNV